MRYCGILSRLINRATGGHPNESLCGRFTRTRGHWCLFCRIVGWLMRDPSHCWKQRIIEIKESRNG